MAYRSRLIAILSLLAFGLVPLPRGRVDAAPATAVDKPTPFGIGATLGNRVREDEQDAAVALMQEAGVQWAREEIFWHELQPQQGGPYLWDGNRTGFYNYDASIGRLHRAEIDILGLLDYNPAWAKSSGAHLDTWIKDWGDFVYNTVARYGRERGQIKYWEIWNEPNLRRFGYEAGLHSIDDVVRLLNVARSAAKAADPESMIVLGGITSIWSEPPTAHDYDVGAYLRLLYEAGGWNSFDILAIHPYRPGAPEASAWRRDTAQDVEAELRIVDGLLAEFGPKPVWITEISWSSYEGYYGVSETDQAAFLVRMYLLALAHPFVQRVFWYTLRDDSAPAAPYEQPIYDRNEPEYHFGLLRRQYPLDRDDNDLRKPAFVAYRTMTDVLGGMGPDGIIANGNNPAMPGTFAYRYSGGGRAALAIWRINAAVTPVVTIDCRCRDARVRQWDGKVLAVVQTEGTVTIRLDYLGVPLYVEWGEDQSTGGRFFPETGHRVAEPFLRYWNDHGGLAQFGLPITGPVNEPAFGTGKPRLVQYFERNRFEYHPEGSDPAFRVQLGRLGDELLARNQIDWRTFPRASDANPACLVFGETGHRICPPFRAYWERNGGLSLYGMPLTEAYEENGLTVQYFERNRFEYHPAKAGTPYEIQLGLLGREIYSRWGVWP